MKVANALELTLLMPRLDEAGALDVCAGQVRAGATVVQPKVTGLP